MYYLVSEIGNIELPKLIFRKIGLFKFLAIFLNKRVAYLSF